LKTGSRETFNFKFGEKKTHFTQHGKKTFFYWCFFTPPSGGKKRTPRVQEKGGGKMCPPRRSRGTWHPILMEGERGEDTIEEFAFKKPGRTKKRGKNRDDLRQQRREETELWVECCVNGKDVLVEKGKKGGKRVSTTQEGGSSSNSSRGPGNCSLGKKAERGH